MEAGKLNTASLNIHSPHLSLGYCFLHNENVPLGVGEQALTTARYNHVLLGQVSGGNENKAILSGSLKADPNKAELQKTIVENISSIAAVVVQPKP